MWYNTSKHKTRRWYFVWEEMSYNNLYLYDQTLSQRLEFEPEFDYIREAVGLSEFDKASSYHINGNGRILRTEGATET